MILKTVGRRKCSVALVKLIQGNGNIVVNEKDLSDYFQNNPKCALFRPKLNLCFYSKFDV